MVRRRKVGDQDRRQLSSTAPAACRSRSGVGSEYWGGGRSRRRLRFDAMNAHDTCFPEFSIIRSMAARLYRGRSLAARLAATSACSAVSQEKNTKALVLI